MYTMNLKIILITLVVFVLLLIYTKNKLDNEYEYFTAGQSETESIPIEQSKTNNVPINPLVYDPKNGTITAGSEFISMPDEVIPPWGDSAIEYVSETGAKFGVADILDDGYHGLIGLQNNMCSKSCCTPQYPTAMDNEHDDAVCNSGENFVPNSYQCKNSWQGAGCKCMTKTQFDFLSSRGGNA